MGKIVIFASGSGSNFEAIVQRTQDGYINGRVYALICDRSDAGVIKRAQKYGVACIVINWRNREKGESNALRILDEIKPDVIVLAGFMKVLSRHFVSRWSGKILNIHPSILPAFAGTTRAIDLAFNYGVKVSGCTVHFVDESVDRGPVIVQVTVPVPESREEFEEKIHKVEHIIYPWVIKNFLEGKIKVDGRRVWVEDTLPPLPR